MTLWQLKVFLTVAKIGSFTQAGKVLRIRQPSVTAVVRSLARELGTELFDKLGVKAHLTTAGKELIPLARELLDKAERIKDRMAEVGGLRKGSIAVGGSAIAAANFLPNAIEDFKKQYPGIEVPLKIEGGAVLEKELLEGELHLAILGWAPRSPMLVGEVYRDQEVVAIAPPDHPLTRLRSVSFKLLAPEPLIIQQRGNPIRDMVEERFARDGYTFAQKLEVSAEHGARDIVKSAVAKGLGIGFISRCHILGDAKAGRVKVLNIPNLKLKRTMYIATHKKRRASWLIQALIEFLRDYKEPRKP